MIDPLPPLCAAALVIMAVQATGATESMPTIVQCERVAAVACSAEGVCIADRIVHSKSITFHLKSKKYWSALGRGSISNQWDLSDGRHSIMAASPPASAEFTFSKDWKSASGGYACEILSTK